MSIGSQSIPTIPQHWRKMKLKYIAELKSGESITSDSISETGGYPVMGGNGLRGYTSAFTHSGTYVLIGRQGELCGNINYASGDFWASEHAVVAHIKGDDDVRWLGELLRSMDLNQYSQSAAQPGISVEVVSHLAIQVPPIAEQRLISSYLDRETAHIDVLIAEKERMLALLEEKRAALINQAVTRGLDPDVPFKPSGLDWLGDIPGHWEIKRLKYLAQVRGGLTLGKKYSTSNLVEMPYLRVANVQDGHLNLEQVTTIEVPHSEAKGYLLKSGDVLMNEGGDIDKLGRGCVWRQEVFPCLHQNHVFAVRPFAVTPEWLSLWTSTFSAKHYFEPRAKRTTNLASISGTNIKELPVPMPSEEEQNRIQGFVARSTSRIAVLRSDLYDTLRLLKERRSALITAAVTGQIDPKEMAA